MNEKLQNMSILVDDTVLQCKNFGLKIPGGVGNNDKTLFG